MRELLRPASLITLVLLVPIVPFVLLGDRFESSVSSWLETPLPPLTLAAGVAAVLVADILLPVPSSVVMTAAGIQLGIPLGILASWGGTTAGAVLGFALARRLGRALVARLASAEDVVRLDALADRFGTMLVIVTRPLPVLAEATVLLLGATGLGWREFLPALMLSNFAVAVVYVALGSWAKEHEQLPLALAASIALPVIAGTIARRLLK